MGDTDFAVVVGISRYPAIGDLAGPVNDARRFEEWLVNRGGVPKGHIETITTPQDAGKMTKATATPMRDQIISALDSIMQNEDERGKVGRRLYLYLAGHGYAPQVDDAALLMANAGGRSFPAIPGLQVARWFRTSARFDEIVLIMDCCRDNYPAIPAQPLPWAEEPSPDADRVKYFYAFATQAYQKAREKPLTPDGEVRGLFTHALLAAFELARPDAQGRITGTAVKNYVLNYMRELAKERYQEPEIPIDSAKDLVLWQTYRAAKLAVEINCGAAGGGEARLTDGNTMEVRSLGPVPASGLLRLELEPGKYRIDIGAAGPGQRFDVIGAPGEVVHVQL